MKKQTGKAAFLILLLVAIDQISKQLAKFYLEDGTIVSLIPGVFQFQYLPGGNSGAAFGLFQGQFWFFLMGTIVILVLFFLFYPKIPEGRRFLPMKMIFLLLISGAIGNFIDRVGTFLIEGRSYVIDFLYFSLIDFPIFNIADCYITLSAIFLIILTFFYYKEEDFSFIYKKKEGK